MRKAFPIVFLAGLCGLLALRFAVEAPPEFAEQPAAPGVTGEFGAEPAQQNFGYTPRPDETERFLRSLAKPTLREAAPELFRIQGEVGDENPVLLYRALYEAHQQFIGQPFVVGRQGIGDCVSWSWKHAADVHLAVMWKLGDSGEWRPAATEPIYGGSRVEARGRQFAGWSDGSYGAAAAKWVKEWGILFRQDYATADLKEYSAQRAKQWGAYGCGGQSDGGKLDSVAKEHPIRNVALVASFEEAAAAIRSGYPVSVCSSQGFTSTRDREGFCRPSGTWMHAMCFLSVRYDRPGLLCLNSWGPSWVNGPKWPEDQPDGSFWVDAKVATRMLSGRDSFAVSGYEGFPPRRLDHGSWVRLSSPSRFLALAP